MKIIKNFKDEDKVQKVFFKTSKGESNNLDIIWLADVHQDSSKTDKKELKRILDKYPDAYIVIGGDHMDIMQNFGDKRASKSDLAVQLKRDDYLNAVMDQFCEFYEPYKERILCINTGNHEGAMVKYHGIDITSIICTRLGVIKNDMTGYLILQVNNERNCRCSSKIYFHHKPISGGQRSKGALSIDIVKGRYPSADVYVTEHIHDSFIKPETVEVLDKQNKLKYLNKWYIQMPTFKDELRGRTKGYAVDKNYGVTSIGCMIMSYELVNNRSVNSKLVLNPRYELL